MNPSWERKLNIARVRLELAFMKMVMEWNNGKKEIQGQAGGFPAATGQSAGDIESQSGDDQAETGVGYQPAGLERK